jgi:VanZ family protein
MLPLRYADRWRTASIVLLLLVLTATLLPAVWFWPDQTDLVSWIAHADKWVHGMIFALLAIWFAGQYRRRSYWRIGIGLIAFGALIESCQGLVSYRSAEWLDIVADAAGIAVGLGIALAGLGGWSVWVENRLQGSKVVSDGD